ncbi:MAG: glycine cleavage system aminomethyltransferase GcvT [Desulfatiglandaceae bacterium]
MEKLRKTPLWESHVRLGAKMEPFAGWDMPVQYNDGIIREHLSVRSEAGIFDVSHMGRFVISGGNALNFLQHVLSNNAQALEVGQSQYTIILDENGCAVDDVYLFRFIESEFLLVVNAVNTERDLNYLLGFSSDFPGVTIRDITDQTAMVSIQGPRSRGILESLIEAGKMPDPYKNALSQAQIAGCAIEISRTGYTGEPLGFEIFVDAGSALSLWDLLMERGARPIGLGARDTLRLEAGLPLYGHELGKDPEGGDIPVFASPLACFAVSFSPLKGAFVGKEALLRQYRAYRKILDRDFSDIEALPRRILPVSVTGRGVPRAGCKVFKNDEFAGYITSGTMVPYFKTEGTGIDSKIIGEHAMRPVCLGLIDSGLRKDSEIVIDIRGKRIPGLVVPYHLRSEAPPYARPLYCNKASIKRLQEEIDQETSTQKNLSAVRYLVRKAAENTTWRRTECINLIPSEQCVSPLVRRLSGLDPAGRYAEHKRVKALDDAEVFYYQGTDFIAEVERLLAAEMCRFLDCSLVETRTISGQMANTAVFSAMVDFLNRADRKTEQRRIRSVLNNHIILGGHLSAQPMGALRDFVARNPVSERPSVVPFPVLSEDPYRIDSAACADVLEKYRPELIIFGKSMVLYSEPVAEIRKIVDALKLNSVIMYDMAHVLGLVGPRFQQPFKEGADIVTGSTHKTFFGTQRGVIASDITETSRLHPLWEAVERRTFPGSVSNHHLGTMLGLLMAAYEMNAFKDEYQAKVLANARTFARALYECGLKVAGDPAEGFTRTHQVVVGVGYGLGPETARRLEKNNIIVNYQAAPGEEGFTAAGSLRMGVSEMTRFGMEAEDFQQLAQLIKDVIIAGRTVKEEILKFRQRFLEMRFQFKDQEIEQIMEKLNRLV